MNTEPDTNTSETTGDGGELRIGYTESAVYVGFILQTIQRFRVERPNVTLKLFPMKSTVQLAALERGELDIGLVWALPDRPSPVLEFERVWSEPFVLAVPSEHALATCRKMTLLQDLESEAFVTISRDGGALFFRTITALCRSAGFTPEIAYEAPDLVTLLGLVATGAGVAIVPQAMHRLHQPGVAYRPIANNSHLAQLHWVSRREENNTPLVPLMRKALFHAASQQAA